MIQDVGMSSASWIGTAPDHGSTSAKVAINEQRQVQLDLPAALPDLLLREPDAQDGKEDDESAGDKVQADCTVAVRPQERHQEACKDMLLSWTAFWGVCQQLRMLHVAKAGK